MLLPFKQWPVGHVHMLTTLGMLCIVSVSFVAAFAFNRLVGSWARLLVEQKQGLDSGWQFVCCLHRGLLH